MTFQLLCDWDQEPIEGKAFRVSFERLEKDALDGRWLTAGAADPSIELCQHHYQWLYKLLHGDRRDWPAP